MKKLLFISIVGIALLGCQGEEAMDAPNEAADLNFGTRSNLTVLCHWDDVTQQFVVLSVNENAVQAHLNHGDQLVDADGDGYTAIGSCTGSADDCDDDNPNVHPGATEICDNGIDDDCDGDIDAADSDCESLIFAIAYSNLNGQDGYQEGSADVLISKLIDFNNDGVVSAGDKVITHQCPTNFVPDSFADFTVKEHVVSGVTAVGFLVIDVTTDGNGRFRWYHEAYQQESYTEYSQYPLITHFGDYFDFYQSGNYVDQLYVNSNSPSAPNQTLTDFKQPAYGDQTFVDIDIFVSQ